MSYALVEDIPATWERYRELRRSLEDRPRGLLLHVAGPTDEGFRIIEVWESEAAWRRYADAFLAALGAVDPMAGRRVVVRDLNAMRVEIGEAWPGSATGAGVRKETGR